VPSLAARQSAPPIFQAILQAFPAPNGPDLGGGVAEWTGYSSRPSGFDGLSARVDQALTARLLLFGRFSDTPSSTATGLAETNSVTPADHAATIGLNAAPTPSATNEFRLNATWSSARCNGPMQSVTVTAASLQALLDSGFSVGLFESAQNSTSIQQFAAFGEDTWRATLRLTIAFGLRWEFDPSPLAPVSSVEVPIWKTSCTDLAPRIGADYRLTADALFCARALAGISTRISGRPSTASTGRRSIPGNSTMEQPTHLP
jgi:outer membrane receptor protein involved in Fe transport